MAVGLTFCGSFGLFTPAFAGQWEIHYEISSGQSKGKDSEGVIIDSFSWPVSTPNVLCFPAIDENHAPGIPLYYDFAEDAAEISNDGSVVTVFQWKPTNNDMVLDPPPVFVNVLETSTAKATAAWDERDPTPTFEVDNGLGSAVEDTGNGMLSTGKKIHHYSVSPKGEVRCDSRTLKAIATAESDGYGVSAYVQYSA